jgi:hypothetical protein
MNLEAITGAAAVAFAGAAAFALLARSGQALARVRTASGNFSACIMPEAGQRVRDQLDLVRRKQAILLQTPFLFAILFVFALLAPSPFQGLPGWLLILVAAILFAAVGWTSYGLLRVILARRRLEFVRDANIAIGQGLQKLSGNLNRVFHEVPCGRTVIGNVVVGLQGIYAVYVLARRPGRHNKLRLQNEHLLFAPGKHRISLAPFTEQSELFARQLTKALKVTVRVRTVIAVPGWEIEEQSGDAWLVVNERNLVMLRGWKDSEEYLMHEDVEQLHELLTDRCIRFGRNPSKAPVSFAPDARPASA